MDLELVKKATGGCKKSFGLLVFSVKDKAYKIAFCYLNNQEDSIDTVYDAMEKAWYGIKKLNQPEFFNTWFIRIVINECKKKLREKDKLIFLEDCDGELGEFQDQLSTIPIKLDIEVILQNLKPLERSMIYMKYYIGYSLEEISRIVEMPLSTVKTRIYNAIGKIKTILQKEGYGNKNHSRN